MPHVSVTLLACHHLQTATITVQVVYRRCIQASESSIRQGLPSRALSRPGSIKVHTRKTYRPVANATVIHIDADPLRMPMPLFYVSAQQRYAAESATTALGQIAECVSRKLSSVDKGYIEDRKSRMLASSENRRAALNAMAEPQPGLQVQEVGVAFAALRSVLPDDNLGLFMEDGEIPPARASCSLLLAMYDLDVQLVRVRI